MSVAQQVFVVFYAIFWGAQSGVQGRWKMFNWPLLCQRRLTPTHCRCALSLMLLNVGQVGMFLAYLRWLNGDESALRGVLLAFGVFCWYRFWLAAVERWPERFYFRCDDSAVTIPRQIEPRFSRSLGDDDKPNCLVLGGYACGNFWTGVAYMLIPTLTVALVKYLA